MDTRSAQVPPSSLLLFTRAPSSSCNSERASVETVCFSSPLEYSTPVSLPQWTQHHLRPPPTASSPALSRAVHSFISGRIQLALHTQPLVIGQALTEVVFYTLPLDRDIRFFARPQVAT